MRGCQTIPQARQQMAGLRIHALAVAVMLLAAGFRDCVAGPPRSDHYALNEIFADQQVHGSALDIQQKAWQLPLEEGCQFLCRRILPNEVHDTLRIPIDFSPTHPAPITRLAADHEDDGGQDRVQVGGDVVSPVFDLLEIAKQLGRLGEIQDQLTNWEPGQQRDGALSKAALLALIALKRDQTDEAVSHLKAMLALRESQPADEGPTSAEWLVFRKAVDDPIVRDAIGDAILRYSDWVSTSPQRSGAQRQLAALTGRLNYLQQAADPQTDGMVDKPLSQWHPASWASAESCGLGFPASQWGRGRGFVANIASHDADYLFFASPLRGNYQVECDVSAFAWQRAHLMVAGVWLEPVYTAQAFDIGSFRRQRPRVAFTPPLTKIRQWLHYRAVVQQDYVEFYLNGRKVHHEPLPPDHDPWLAIRSSARHDGSVRNLRITGDLSVPEQVLISAGTGLDSWNIYFGYPPSGPNIHWWSADGEIRTGPADEEPKTSIVMSPPQYYESLLRYLRPMFEDGSIEYEFLYLPGEVLVHPALDRLAFLLEPAGVRIHWITDGAYERSDLDPANAFYAPDCMRGPTPLPLHEGEWNRLQLTLAGDTAALKLNGETIFERKLEPTNQRTFGLFHYADQTQVRVRNVVMQGDWPRKLPTLAEQELAIDEASECDETANRLSAVFEHDFAAEGMPRSKFAVVHGNWEGHLQETSQGLLARREGTEGYRSATVAPNLSLQGDFDVIAQYDHFQADPAADGHANVILSVALDDGTEGVLCRRHVSKADFDEQYILCVRVTQQAERQSRQFLNTVPAEERSGRLRLSRRGDRLYFFTAEGSSPNFQLREQCNFPKSPVRLQGIELTSQIFQQGGETSVVWKSLSIRAERMQGPALHDLAAAIAELNQQRDQLAERFVHDFVKQPPGKAIRAWNLGQVWSKRDAGLRFVARGADSWMAVGADFMQRITGDFDAVAHFTVLPFEAPRTGDNCSVYLQVNFADPELTQLSSIYRIDESGRGQLVTQLRQAVGNGKYRYQPFGRLEVDGASTLRIARRGRRFDFLIAEKPGAEEHLVSTFDSLDVPILDGELRFMVHTAGVGHKSEVILKSLEVRAESLGPK